MKNNEHFFHLHVPFRGSKGDHVLVPRASLGTAPLQHLRAERRTRDGTTTNTQGEKTIIRKAREHGSGGIASVQPRC